MKKNLFVSPQTNYKRINLLSIVLFPWCCCVYLIWRKKEKDED